MTREQRVEFDDIQLRLLAIVAIAEGKPSDLTVEQRLVAVADMARRTNTRVAVLREIP